MHPLLATMYATTQAADLANAAETRRRTKNSRPERRHITLKRPRMKARIAHA